MDIRIIERPFVVHQFHEQFRPGDVRELMKINKVKLDRTCAQNGHDVKRYNKIYR